VRMVCDCPTGLPSDGQWLQPGDLRLRGSEEEGVRVQKNGHGELFFWSMGALLSDGLSNLSL